MTKKSPIIFSTQQQKSQNSSGKLVLALIVVGVIILLFVVVGTKYYWREQAKSQLKCYNNLRILAMAIQHYCQVHGRFPPPYTTGYNGKPWHSWRILILPFLEESRLYDQYKFNEPWNGPNNSKLMDKMPEEYHCPLDGDTNNHNTSYMMIVGKGAIPEASGVKYVISDGADNTIMLVEVSGSGVNWMEPKDLNADTMSYRINNPARLSIRSNHPNNANTVLFNGQILTLDNSTDPAIVKALTTIDGGENIKDFLEKLPKRPD